MVLRLGWILVIQVLEVQVELPWLVLVRKGSEVRELGDRARLRNTRRHR